MSKDAIFTLIISYPAKLLCMLWQNKDIFRCLREPWGFPGDSVVKNPPANAGDTGASGSIPGLGRSPGEGNGNPLQCSCLGYPMDRGAWQAIVHGVAKELDMT